MSLPLACLRCKTKKIRCDALSPSCTACRRANKECLIADLLTNRQYKRGYIEALEARIAYLNTALQEGRTVPLDSGPTVHGLSQGDIVESTPGSVQGSPSNNNGEPRSLSKVLGDASGTKLAKLIIETLKQAASQFDVRRSSTSPPETTQLVNDLTPVAPNPLPSRMVADRLLKTYLKGPHVIHPFLQLSEIAQTCDRVYSSASPTPKDLFALNMIFAIGAVSLTRTGQHDRPIPGYYAAAMVHSKEVLQLSGLHAIQAILLVLVFRIYYHASGLSVWDLSRLAVRICIEEGLHLEPDKLMPPMEHQMRRRVFWDCYVLDRRSSQMLGWPFAIQDEDIQVSLPRDLDDHEILDPDGMPAPCARRTEPSSQAAFLHLIRMRQITSRVRQAQIVMSANSTVDLIQLEELHQILQDWRSSAPVYSCPRSVYHTPEWFDLSYHMEVLALFRPFLSRDRPEITTRCLESSLGVIFAYSDIFNSKQSLYTWTYVYALYTAGLCCIFCIMASSSATGGPSSFDTTRVKAGISRCRQTLKDISTKWPVISRHAESIDILGNEVSRALDERPDHFWKEVEEATMSGLSQTIENFNRVWNGIDQGPFWTDDLAEDGFSASQIYNDLFSNTALNSTAGSPLSRDPPLWMTE